MKEEEKQRKFHEALLKMLYPPPSDSGKEDGEEEEEEEEEEDEQAEKNLIKLLNDPLEEEIENEEPSAASSSNDNRGGDEKLTRAQRKRLRKRKLREALIPTREKFIGPLLPASNDPSHGSVDAAEGVRGNVATNVSGDLISHGSVEVVSNAPQGVRQNVATNVWEEEASCSKKNKMKLKQRRKSKKMADMKSTPSSTTNRNEGLKMTVDDSVGGG